MTNIFEDPEKHSRKTELMDIAIQALEQQGYVVERVAGSGKSSVRRLTKGGKSLIATIRTTQDTWIAFPRTDDDKAWKTLDEADLVVAASVDSRESPRFANIHLIPGDDMRKRFDRARTARMQAGRKMSEGRGMWISLYHPEAKEPVSLVGAGAGLAYPPIARVRLGGGHVQTQDAAPPPDSPPPGQRERFTIADAKRMLAAYYEVPESAITITISN
jgi:hypothetical protein